MIYEPPLFRPPSEARSLIFQVTIGCSHNKCSFCSMYKGKMFRIKSMDEILLEIKEAGKRYPQTEKIFLADGDALIMPLDNLMEILNALKTQFKNLKRISAYATPQDVLRKGKDALDILKRHGLSLLYMGIETGDDTLLNHINKGVSSSELISAGKMVRSANIQLSVTAISGLGGKNGWKTHAIETAKVVSAISPEYFGLLTLMIEEGTMLHESYIKGTFETLTPREVLVETKMLISNLSTEETIFRSNHASNYLSLAGTLPKDQERLIQEIDHYIDEDEVSNWHERYRSL